MNCREQMNDVELVMLYGHEKAHLFGYTIESDATLFAFRAFLESKNPLLQYAARCSLLRAMNRLSVSLPTEVVEEFAKQDVQHETTFLEYLIKNVVVEQNLYLRGQGGIEKAYTDDTLAKEKRAYAVAHAQKLIASR